MDRDRGGLAAAGAAAIVEAAAGGDWRLVEARMGALFGTPGARQRLAETRELLDSVPLQELDLQCRRLTAGWTARLEDLLVERPEVAGELRGILEELSSPGRP